MKKILFTALLASAFSTALAADKAAEKKSDYPLKTCVVSDEALGSMGKPVVVKLEGKEYQLCCKSCEKDLKKDTKKYAKKLEAAAKKPEKEKAK